MEMAWVQWMCFKDCSINTSVLCIEYPVSGELVVLAKNHNMNTEEHSKLKYLIKKQKLENRYKCTSHWMYS